VNFPTAIRAFLHSWYFGQLKRAEAEKRLLQQCNDHGAFLIRDSESRRVDYSLSGQREFVLYYFCL